MLGSYETKRKNMVFPVLPKKKNLLMCWGGAGHKSLNPSALAFGTTGISYPSSGLLLKCQCWSSQSTWVNEHVSKSVLSEKVFETFVSNQ